MYLWCVFLLLLLLHCANSQECRPQQYLLSANQVLNITSPNYPNAYQPGSQCRYRIMAPLDHVVVLSCTFEVAPDTCNTEFFYISRDGDYQFRDSENFCRTNRMSTVSHYRAIAFAYYSSTPLTSSRGRFLCQAYARPQPCNCGWSMTTRITNGQEAIKNEYPFMVALRDVTSIQRVFCGGSIVSHRHIISAAHCRRTQPDPGRVMAYVGDHDLTSETESPFAAQHRILQIIIHPSYTSNGNTVSNDIALYITATTMEWSRGVGPICLPLRQASETFAYVNVDVIGWGTIAFAGAKSNTLQKVQLLTMDNGACQTQYSNTSIQSGHICTYDYRGLGQDSCQYDSGGPVVLKQHRMFLVGVISFGQVCGTRYGIGVNTRITSNLNWLWGYIGGGVCTL